MGDPSPYEYKSKWIKLGEDPVGNTAVKFVGAAVILIFVMAGLALVMGYPTKWIVNYLFASTFLVKVFGVAKLTFWKAFWLNWLSGILFKSSTVTSK